MVLVEGLGVLSLSMVDLSLLVVAPTDGAKLKKLILQFFERYFSEWLRKDISQVLSGGDISEIKISSGFSVKYELVLHINVLGLVNRSGSMHVS